MLAWKIKVTTANFISLPCLYKIQQKNKREGIGTGCSCSMFSYAIKYLKNFLLEEENEFFGLSR